MNKSEEKYNECVELLHSLHDVVTLICQLTNTEGRSALDIVRESLDSMQEYDNLTPEQKLEIEKETEQLYEMLTQDVEVEQEKVNNRKTKKKKGLLN